MPRTDLGGSTQMSISCIKFRCKYIILQQIVQLRHFFSSGMADHALRLGPYMRRSSKNDNYIDTCGHVGGQIRNKNKTKKPTTRSETQIPQPDLRFAIRQRNKPKSERGRAQQKQPHPRFAKDRVVKSHCVTIQKKMHKRIGCCSKV